MNAPLVSIVLPVYNGYQFLKESVDSVISQTYTNWELIIVDDCSTDETPKIIKEYEARDKRIRSIRHSENLYLPQALNTGFKSAKGELFTWTSDDNIYLSNAISRMVEVLYDEGIDIVYSEERIIDENGRWVSKSDVIAQIGTPDEIPILSCIGGCFLHKKNVFFDVGGYESQWFLVEDWQFWLKAYNKGFKFKKIDEVTYLYRDNSKSLTSLRSAEIQRKCLELSLINLKKNQEIYSREIIMRAYLKCVGYAYRIPDKLAGKKCMRRAIEVNKNAFDYLKTEIKEWVGE